MGTNIFIGGSIKTSINSILDNPIASDGNQAFLLVVSNAVDNTNSVSLSLTNMQTGAIYSYTGLGHGNGDSNLYFYLPAGDYPVESEDVLGFYVGADGNSGTMALNPADWTEEQRTIAAVSVNGSSNVLTLIHPLGTHADDFHIEGADKVESNAWNWNIISHSTDENGVITIFTNTPALMLRLQY